MLEGLEVDGFGLTCRGVRGGVRFSQLLHVGRVVKFLSCLSLLFWVLATFCLDEPLMQKTSPGPQAANPTLSFASRNKAMRGGFAPSDDLAELSEVVSS